MATRTWFPVAIAFMACAPAEPPPNTRQGAPEGSVGVASLTPSHPQTVYGGASADGRFELRLRTAPDPIPLNEPFELIVEMTDLETGLPVEAGTLACDAVMPGHGHGMLRIPEAELEAPGRWRVRGMLFHMGGDWDLNVRYAWQDASEEFFSIRHVDYSFGVRPVAADRELQSELRAYFDRDELSRMVAATPLPEVPADPTNRVADTEEAFAFGRQLFYEERLSGDGSMSCATCHDPELGWSDGLALGQGAEPLELHTPTLWNAGHQRWQFWDGRADSLWSQALKPIEGAAEMAGDRTAVAELLATDPELAAGYERAFDAHPAGQPGDLPDPAEVERVFVNVGKALAAFERRIVSGETRFDRFVRGLETGDADDLAELNADERAGAKLFFGRANCHLCHHGPTFSDLEFHDVRLPATSNGDAEPLLVRGRYDAIVAVLRDPYNGLGGHSDDRGELAREKLDYLNRTPHMLGELKTPGLRNVSQSAPYMHTGQFATLEEVVEHYSTLAGASPKRHRDAEDVLVPLHLTEAEKAQLVSFLKSLDGGPAPQALLDPEIEREPSACESSCHSDPQESQP